MEHLRNTLAAAMELSRGEEVRRLAGQDPKVCALVVAIRNIEAVTEQAADDIARERTEEIVKATEKGVASYFEQRRTDDDLRYTDLVDRYSELAGLYSELLNVYKWTTWRIEELSYATTVLQSEIRRQENKVKLRDLGLDFKDEVIEDQKRKLEEWEAWGRQHGWTPRDFGYQLLPDEPSTAGLNSPGDTVAKDDTSADADINTDNEDIKSEKDDSIAEDVPNRLSLTPFGFANINFRPYFRQTSNSPSTITFDRPRNSYEEGNVPAPSTATSTLTACDVYRNNAAAAAREWVYNHARSLGYDV